jgi:hypothetical protein
VAGTSLLFPLSGAASKELSPPVVPVAPGDVETPLLMTKMTMMTQCQKVLSKMIPCSNFAKTKKSRENNALARESG